MTDDELRDFIREARAIAEPVGPLHGLWDLITDAEETLKGRPTILSRPVLETAIAKEMARQVSLRSR